MLRRLPPPGHRRGGVDGGLRGRAGPQERIPPVRRRGPSQGRRRRLDPRGDHAAVPALPGGAGGHRRRSSWPAARTTRSAAAGRRSTRRPAGRASSPTRPTWSWSTAARRRWPPPRRALDELGIDDVAAVGLAKRLEEVWLPGEDHPVILPRTSEGLYLLQRVRDEAHRSPSPTTGRRSKSMKESALDDVPGLGRARRQALLRHFGSVKRLRRPPPTRSPRCRASGDRRRRSSCGARRRRRRLTAPAAPGRSRAATRRTPSAVPPPIDGRRDPGRGATRGARSRALGHRDHRHVRRRAQHRGQGAGGPRLVRGRQPAARAVADAGRAGRAGPGRGRRLAAVVDVRSRAFFTRPRRGHRGARRPRRRPSGASSWRPATRRWCAGSRTSGGRTRCRARGRLVDGIAARARAARATSAPTPTWSSTPRDLNVHELRAQDRRGVRRRGPDRRCGSPWSRSATSTGCRSTPTSWSTAGSCPTRTGCPSCGR